MNRCNYCEVVLLRPLGEEERDAITAKFAQLLNKKSDKVITEVKTKLQELEEVGYDVKNYVRALEVITRMN